MVEYRFRPAEHELRVGTKVQIQAIATDNRETSDSITLEPNVSRSDPIEIKITTASRLPDPNDPDAGGLSEPDDRPASDHQDNESDQPNQQGTDGSQDKQQQAGGGSGDADAESRMGINKVKLDPVEVIRKVNHPQYRVPNRSEIVNTNEHRIRSSDGTGKSNSTDDVSGQ